MRDCGDTGPGAMALACLWLWLFFILLQPGPGLALLPQQLTSLLQLQPETRICRQWLRIIQLSIPILTCMQVHSVRFLDVVDK